MTTENRPPLYKLTAPARLKGAIARVFYRDMVSVLVRHDDAGPDLYRDEWITAEDFDLAIPLATTSTPARE